MRRFVYESASMYVCLCVWLCDRDTKQDWMGLRKRDAAQLCIWTWLAIYVFLLIHPYHNWGRALDTVNATRIMYDPCTTPCMHHNIHICVYHVLIDTRHTSWPATGETSCTEWGWWQGFRRNNFTYSVRKYNICSGWVFVLLVIYQRCILGNGMAPKSAPYHYLNAMVLCRPLVANICVTQNLATMEIASRNKQRVGRH